MKTYLSRTGGDGLYAIDLDRPPGIEARSRVCIKGELHPLQLGRLQPSCMERHHEDTLGYT